MCASILASASASLTPVNVITPVPLLYDSEPSPPASVTLILPLALPDVKYWFEPSDKSPVLLASSEIATTASDASVTASVPLELVSLTEPPKSIVEPDKYKSLNLLVELPKSYVTSAAGII